jgi:hypothetical protein
MIGDPYEGEVISWIAVEIKRIISEDINVIDTFFACFHNLIIANTENIKFAKPDMKITASGKLGLPSISVAEVMTVNMYVTMPYIANVLFFMLFY